MYWQKRFDREDPDAELLQIMRGIREEHKDYGYRRIHGELRKQGIKINKKRVQRIVQKYGMQVTSFTRKADWPLQISIIGGISLSLPENFIPNRGYYVKNSSAWGGLMRFYAYFCHAIDDFACFELQH